MYYSMYGKVAKRSFATLLFELKLIEQTASLPIHYDVKLIYYIIKLYCSLLMCHT